MSLNCSPVWGLEGTWTKCPAWILPSDLSAASSMMIERRYGSLGFGIEFFVGPLGGVFNGDLSLDSIVALQLLLRHVVTDRLKVL